MGKAKMKKFVKWFNENFNEFYTGVKCKAGMITRGGKPIMQVRVGSTNAEIGNVFIDEKMKKHDAVKFVNWFNKRFNKKTTGIDCDAVTFTEPDGTILISIEMGRRDSEIRINDMEEMGSGTWLVDSSTLGIPKSKPKIQKIKKPKPRGKYKEKPRRIR